MSSFASSVSAADNEQPASSSDEFVPRPCDVFEEDDYTDRLIGFNPTFNAESALDAHLASTHGGVRPADRPRMSPLAKSQLPPAPSRRRSSISNKLRPVVNAAAVARIRRSFSRSELLDAEHQPSSTCSFANCSSPWSSSLRPVPSHEYSTTCKCNCDGRKAVEDRALSNRFSADPLANMSHESVPSARGMHPFKRNHGGVSSFPRFSFLSSSRASPRASDATGSSRDASDSPDPNSSSDPAEEVDDSPSLAALKNHIVRNFSNKFPRRSFAKEHAEEDPWVLFHTAVKKRNSPAVKVMNWFRSSRHRRAAH